VIYIDKEKHFRVGENLVNFNYCTYSWKSKSVSIKASIFPLATLQMDNAGATQPIPFLQPVNQNYNPSDNLDVKQNGHPDFLPIHFKV